jgi:hypothetical protein
MFKFSEQLRNELIEYFQNTKGILISQNQADDYLDSLADLFINLNDLRQ